MGGTPGASQGVPQAAQDDDDAQAAQDDDDAQAAQDDDDAQDKAQAHNPRSETQAPQDKPQASQGASQGAGSSAWTQADLSDDAQVQTGANLSDIGDRASAKAGQTPAQTMTDNAGAAQFLGVRPSKSVKLALGNKGAKTQALAEAISTPARLRRHVTQAVRSPDLEDLERFQTRGRLDRRAWTRMEAGAENIFRRRSETIGQNCAVSLLLDLSDSMKHHRAIDAAASLAIHLGDALKAAAVPFEVLGFTSVPSILVIKGFDLPWQVARPMMGNISTLPDGGTAMLPGMMAASNRLLAMGRVSRRILLVLTDGDDDYTVQANRACIRAQEARGVEIVGIGIGRHDVSGVFKRFINVRSLADVAAKGLDALVAVLDAPKAS